MRSFLPLAACAAAACASANPREPAPAAVQVNVHAVLPAALEAQLAEVDEALFQKAGLPSFRRQGRPTHVTLYMTWFDPAVVPSLEGRVRALGLRRFPVRTAGVRRTAGGWFFLDLARDPGLADASLAVAEALAPLRSLGQQPPSWAKGLPEKLATWERYGSPGVGAHFEPHATLLAASEAAAVAPVLEMPWPEASGTVEELRLAFADGDGQITEVVGRVALIP